MKRKMTMSVLLLWVPILLSACGGGDDASALATDVSAVYLGEAGALEETEDGAADLPGEEERYDGEDARQAEDLLEENNPFVAGDM